MNRRPTTCFSAFAALIALSSPASAENWALVMGVNDCPEFRLPDGSRPRALRGAERDAQSFADMLAEQFRWPREQMRVLLGKDATRATFEKALQEIAYEVGPDDAFVLYFAGHGTQLADQRPLDEADKLDEALCLADATADARTLVRDDEIGKWLEAFAAGHVTVIFDCCHAGTGIKDLADEVVARYLPIAPATARLPQRDEERQPPWQDLRSTSKSLERRTLTALFACQPEQQAYERRFSHQKAPHRSGQFTHHLLTALKDRAADANGDRQVTAAEATAFIQQRLDEGFNNARSAATDRQEPVCEVNVADRSLFPAAAR